MNLNPAININAERLFTALQDNTVFVKAQNSDDIAKVELDYQTFVQLQELLSHLSHKDIKQADGYCSLADTFRNLKMLIKWILMSILN